MLVQNTHTHALTHALSLSPCVGYNAEGEKYINLICVFVRLGAPWAPLIRILQEEFLFVRSMGRVKLLDKLRERKLYKILTT